MLGASIYLAEPLSENLAYLKTVAHQGVHTIFTSLHLPEDDPQATLAALKVIAKEAQALALDLIIDISTATLERYELSLESGIAFFKELGASSLRMDYGFSPKAIANYAKHFQVVLNASTVDENLLKELQEAGANLKQFKVMHNFYPRELTGLSLEFLTARNQLFKNFGLTVMAFIPGFEKTRGPLHAGLPTVEAHRTTDALTAYLELQQALVDEVVVGDIQIKTAAAERIQAWEEQQLITLPVHLVVAPADLPPNFWEVQQNRQDVAAKVIRSAMSRVVLKDETIAPVNTVERPRGAITIDNDAYGRYKGEIQLLKMTAPADQRVNVLGQVHDSALTLLEHIGSNQKFRFVEVD